MKLASVFMASALALGLTATATAKNYVISLPETGITVPTSRTFSDSFSFALGKSTDLDIAWSSKNLYLDVLLFKKVGNSFQEEAASMLSSGSFASDFGKGKYFLDFLGMRQSTGKSSYSFSVMAVPEADTWAMILLGGALVGYQLRRKHKMLPRQPLSAG
jgi:hypothetical protein